MDHSFDVKSNKKSLLFKKKRFKYYEEAMRSLR